MIYLVPCMNGLGWVGPKADREPNIFWKLLRRDSHAHTAHNDEVYAKALFEQFVHLSPESMSSSRNA